MTYHRHGRSIYKTKQWAALRLLARRRDGFACVLCGAKGKLEVDHVQPIRNRPDLALELSNLQSLCTPCHSRKTRLEIGLGRENPERDAWKSLLRDMRNHPLRPGE